MKTIIKILLVFVLSFTLTNCEKESEGLSRVTYYAEISLVGDAVTIPLGGTYSEPGYSGTENGVDKTGDIVVTDNIDVNTAGVYYVTYELFNSDGYPTVSSRMIVVAVIDAGAPISGLYTTNMIRTEADGSAPRERGPFSIAFVNEGNDVYYVECLLGQWYSIGSAYGPAYAAVGRIKLDKATNTFSLIESSVEGFEDSLAGFQNASYNPVTGIINWEAIYAGGDIFSVTLTK